jgi:tryptophan halogenase
MASKLDDLLPAIIAAKNAGLTVGAIRAKFIGKSKAKVRSRNAELGEQLASLVREGAIWGPLRYGPTQYYFATGYGPSIEIASESVMRLVFQSGVKLLSRAGLEKKVTGMNRRFFADGIKHAVASRAIVELACGASKYYLHRDVAAEYFGVEATSAEANAAREASAPVEPKLAFEDLLPIYRRLKTEQGGFSAVKIFDLAAAVVHVLGEHVRATRVDARVEELHTSADGVRVRLDEGTTHLCDYVFDARGFPRDGAGSAEDFIQLDWIPTGRAMIRRLRPQGLSGVSRIVARPHGWIFQIPLRDWTSCGYVFNPRISSDAEVAADLTAFLHAEGVVTWEQRGAPSFPNFMRRKMFDGRVFWCGNAATFIEPLEATTIGHAIGQIRSATRWIVEEGRGRCAEPDEVEEFNGATLSYVCCDSLFVAWHYACGSRWDTPFWQYVGAASNAHATILWPGRTWPIWKSS